MCSHVRCRRVGDQVDIFDGDDPIVVWTRAELERRLAGDGEVFLREHDRLVVSAIERETTRKVRRGERGESGCEPHDGKLLTSVATRASDECFPKSDSC